MPPKKDGTVPNASAKQKEEIPPGSIENFELPKSTVTDLGRAGASPSSRFQPEAITAFRTGSTVFINYLAATAHDVALSKQHKSISASDVIRALEIVQFQDIVSIIQDELEIYREQAKTDKNKRGPSGLSVSAKAGSSASAPVKARGGTGTLTPTSISAAPGNKGKGKGKAKDNIGSSGVNTPQMSSLSISNAGPGPMDIDDEQEGDSQDIEEELYEIPYYTTQEDPYDAVAIEEEEVIRDSRGLDVPAGEDDS